MKTMLLQIHAFDSANLSLTEIFDREKEISEDLYARTAFGEVSLADSKILKSMLEGVTKNKIKAFENVIVQPKKIQYESIADIIVQKITIPVKNTAVSPVGTPFYNMRETVDKIRFSRVVLWMI